MAVVLWGVFAAPTSKRRIDARGAHSFELAVFGLAEVALLAAGSQVAAVMFAVVVVVNAALITVFGQWEQ